MRKYWILIICLLLVIAGIIVWITGPISVDWSMTAYLIAADGTIESSFPITIQGKIRDSKKIENMADLFLDIEVPKDFRYSFGNSDDALPAWNGTEFEGGNPNDLRTVSSTYDKETNWTSNCYYVINPELGYFVAYWPDEGFYLVAATDTDVKTSDVIAHFHLYFDAWGISAGE